MGAGGAPGAPGARDFGGGGAPPERTLGPSPGNEPVSFFQPSGGGQGPALGPDGQPLRKRRRRRRRGRGGRNREWRMHNGGDPGAGSPPPAPADGSGGG
jgi:hypothetical protein